MKKNALQTEGQLFSSAVLKQRPLTPGPCISYVPRQLTAVFGHSFPGLRSTRWEEDGPLGL